MEPKPAKYPHSFAPALRPEQIKQFTQCDSAPNGDPPISERRMPREKAAHFASGLEVGGGDLPASTVLARPLVVAALVSVPRGLSVVMRHPP